MSRTQQPIDSLEVYSMTGFGQAQVNSKLCRLNLQLKSVNSRFLDLTLKIPDELAAFEGKLREAITHAVKRGKVEARLSWQTLLPSDGEAEVALINTQALAQVLAVQNAILNHAPNASPMSVSALMNAPAVLPSSVGASEVLSAVTADEINDLIASAIAQFKQSRQQEGAHLAQTIFERLDAIGGVVHNLRVQLPENGVAQALAALDGYQRDKQLLDRDVSVIDLRVPGMVSLKLGDLGNQAWADFRKKNKHASKGEAEYETAAERAAESKPQ